jgi:hypothetical protein
MLGEKYDSLKSRVRHAYNTEYNTDDEEEKNFRKKGAYLSNTYQEFSSGKKKLPELSYFENFPGFYNKKFNLTSFRKEREDSRSRSRSPERIINPHKMKGNGIPKDIVARIKLFGKIFDSEKFKRFLKTNVTKNKTVEFNEICEKIIKFAKKYSQLEGIMMVYYFICNYISYDYTFLQRNDDYKKTQSIEHIFRFKRALSLGYTNLFETFMKKLGVKCKHIEGYCKLLPDREIYMAYNNSRNNNSSIMRNNTSIYNTKENFNSNNNKNSSIVFTMHNNSSVINNRVFEASKTVSKLNFYNDFETENDLTNYVNHCWNAIFYKGEWYFVDTVLGSCNFSKSKVKSDSEMDSSNNSSNNILYMSEEDTNFNPFFFMTSPEHMINSHLPGNDSWQMIPKFCTLKQFLSKRTIDYAKFFKGLYRYDVELLTHQSPFIQANLKEQLVIQLKLFSYLVEAHLYDSTGHHKISEVRFSTDRKSGIISIEPIFPKPGEYILKMNIRAINSTDLIYKPFLDYVILVGNNLSFNHFEKYKKLKSGTERDKIDDGLFLPKIHGSNLSLNKKGNTISQGRIITDYNKIFPSKNNKVICYDSEGFVLIEPKTIYIRKGMVTKFKLRIKGAHSVFLLDGNKWTFLKKVEENTFQGQKEIKTDNVSVCCLKNKNVFTEVFRFKTKKKMFLSKSFGLAFRKQRNDKNINKINDTEED